MSIGPVKMAGIVSGRIAAPTAYMNPLGDSSLVSWVANPANTHVVSSIILVVFMACSSLWLLHGAVAFAKSETTTFALALMIGLGLGLAMVEGGKYDPLQLDQSMFAFMVMIAYLSSAGRLFNQKADKEKDDKKK